MITFIAVCVGVLTIVHLAALAVLFQSLVDFRRASQAVESLAYVAREYVAQAQSATQKIHNFANWTGSGWQKILPVIISASVAAWSRRNSLHKSSEN